MKFLRFLFVVVIAGMIFWLLNSWALPAIGLPQPFEKLAHVALIVGVCVLIIDGALGMIGKNFIHWW